MVAVVVGDLLNNNNSEVKPQAMIPVLHELLTKTAMVELSSPKHTHAYVADAHPCLAARQVHTTEIDQSESCTFRTYDF